MAGSSFGEAFRISTWGESHGAALGVVVDGVPAGLRLDTNRIQEFMDRRKPGQSKFTTARKEADAIEILSGVFEGKTTGTPISMMVRNADQHSKDYSNIAEIFRPGHADYTFYEKYGIRDYRGGGRSSGRETIGRVAAGAIAIQILEELGVEMCAYTKAIGPAAIASFDADEIRKNPLAMPDAEAAKKAQAYLEDCISRQDSAGGVLGGMSDGDEIIFRVAVKPTPSISQPQKTVNVHGEEQTIEIHGRHDPVIVPRAVVVVESMAAITLVDALFSNMSARMDRIVDFYQKK